MKKRWDICSKKVIKMKITLENCLHSFLDTILSLRKEVKDIDSQMESIEEQIFLIETESYEDILDEPNINETLQKININSFSIQNTINKLEEENSDENETISRIKTNHIKCIKNSFMKSMKKYQMIQVQMKKTLQRTLYNKIIIFNPELKELIDENEIDQINPQFLQLIGNEQDQQVIQFLHQQYNELLSIKNSIEELHDMFLSFSLLIEVQKEAINTLEDTCNSIKDYIEEVNSNVRESYELQKKYLKVCCSSFNSFVSSIERDSFLHQIIIKRKRN